MRFGLKYAFEPGLRDMEVESDCSQLISLVRSGSTIRGHTQVLINDIFSRPRQINFCSFNFNLRACNSCAHSLAKVALNLEEVLVWMEDCPADIFPLVMVDK
ncbi:Zona pellucida sperm-binding protein 1 [Bienertia sinuspersici]